MFRDETQRLFNDPKKNEKMRLMCEDLHYFRIVFSNLNLSEDFTKKLMGEFLRFLDNPDSENYKTLETKLEKLKEILQQKTSLSLEFMLGKLQEYKSLSEKRELEKNAIFEAVWYLAGHEDSSNRNNRKLRQAVIANLKLGELKDQKSFTGKYESRLKNLMAEEHRKIAEERLKIAEERRKHDEALNKTREKQRATQKEQQERREQNEVLNKIRARQREQQEEERRRENTASSRKPKDPSLSERDEALVKQINKAEQENKAKKIRGDEYFAEIERQRRKKADEARPTGNQRIVDERIAQRLEAAKMEHREVMPSPQTKTDEKTKTLQDLLTNTSIASRYENFVYKEKQSVLHQWAHRFAKKERTEQIAVIDKLRKSLAGDRSAPTEDKAEILHSALTLLNAQVANERRTTDAKSRLGSLLEEELKELEKIYPHLKAQQEVHQKLNMYGRLHSQLGIATLIAAKPKERKSKWKPINK